MTRSMRARTFLVAVGFAVPALAGQAVPRTSGSSSSSSGGGGATASGGSSSSSSGGSSGGSSSTSSPTGASGQPMFGGVSRSTPSRIASGNSSRTSGSATARPAPTPGGVTSVGAVSTSSNRGGGGSDQNLGFGGDPYARNSNGRPITGAAAPRPPQSQLGGNYVSFPFYGPWGLWYPWYGGFGWNMGWVTYNPWYYGATSWYWGPYGMWYDPYSYWDPYRYGGRSSVYSEREPKVVKTTGSIRIKANPSSAKVYLDNALVGLVEEFNGLNDGLEIEGGRHVLEIRADGYVTQTQEIDVKVGSKRTIRMSLKKK